MISRRKRPSEGSRSPVPSRPPSRTSHVKQSTDKVYFVQNQNEVLKLKNFELEAQLGKLTDQQHRESVKSRLAEDDCVGLENQIRMQRVSPEIILATQKRKLADQIKLLENDYKLWEKKIFELQRSIMEQEDNVMPLIARKQEAEVDLWKVRMESEGMKVVVSKLEAEIDQLRIANEQIAKSRKNYGPEEQRLAANIETQLSDIKAKEQIRKNNLKKISAASLFKNLERIYLRVLGTSSLNLKANSTQNVIFRKKLFGALKLSQSYLTRIKYNALGKFKALLTPWNQQVRMKILLQNCRSLRVKSSIFSKWRKEFIKAQYSMIRKLQVLGALDRIQMAFQQNYKYNCFNMLRGYKRDMVSPLRNLMKVGERLHSRMLAWGLSNIRAFCQGKYLDNQIENSSRLQTENLIKSLYFGALAVYTRQLRPYKRAILTKYFKLLKKNKTNKRKRQLQDVISLVVEKNSINSQLVRAFSALRYGTTMSATQNFKQQQVALKEENTRLKNNLENFEGGGASQFRMISLAKVGKVLLMATRRAFHRWRKWNFKRTRFLGVLQLLHNKNFNDKNLGFAKIQTRRFQRLKVSIADKIQSCEFSYNYLTEENAHIKEVLDRKTLEVQKTKFVKILKNLVNAEKDAKRKFFYKFLQRGHKVWKVKQTTRRLESLSNRKIKQVFMYELKQKIYNENKQARKQHSIELLIQKSDTRTLRLAIQGFIQNWQCNKKMKRALVFSVCRNIELNYNLSYLLIKSIYLKNKQEQQYKEFSGDVAKLKLTNQNIERTEAQVAILTDKLKSRTTSMQNRNVIACKIFFTKSIKTYVMHYIDRWRDKLSREKRMMKFADSLELKLRINIQGSAFRCFVRAHYQRLNDELNEKLSKFSKEMDEMNDEFSNFAATTDAKIADLKQQTISNSEVAAYYKKRYAKFNEIRVRSFKKNFGRKYLAGAILKKWKKMIENQRKVLDQYLKRVRLLGQRLYFPEIMEEMRDISYMSRIKRCIHRNLRDSYWHNTQLFLRRWRFQAQQFTQTKKNRDLKEARELQRSADKRLEDRIESFENDAVSLTSDRISRKLFTGFRRYVTMKRTIRQKGSKLHTQLNKRHCHEFISLVSNCTKKHIKLSRKLKAFQHQTGLKRQKAFLTTVWKQRRRRYIFEHNFLNMFVGHWVRSYATDFFANLKLYQRARQIYLLDQKTKNTQMLVEAIDNKRRKVIAQALRRFRKNLLIRTMQINLMRRLTRKAMNKRLQLCFFTWRLEAEARNVIYYHSTEGQTRKRERQFLRTKKYIEDLKRQKGLLLQNDQGNLVLSPRFMERKQQQSRSENMRRYKLVSRLLLFANGEYATIKSWNAIHLYAVMRTKIRKAAQSTLNHLRYPQQFKAFKLWRGLLKDQKQMLDNMPRADLVKILQRQKDKIEVEYSKKLSNQEVMNRQIRRFQVLERQGDIRERLCSCILIRWANRKKQLALRRWRQATSEQGQSENNELEMKGDNRLASLERQIQELQGQYEEQIVVSQQLKQTAMEGFEIAEAVRKLTMERDQLNKELTEKAMTCQALLEENILLNNRFNLAHEEAFQLLSLTRN